MYSCTHSYMHLINTFHHRLSARCWRYESITCRLMTRSSGSVYSLPLVPGVSPRASGLTVERLLTPDSLLLHPLFQQVASQLSVTASVVSASLHPVMLLAWALPLLSAQSPAPCSSPQHTQKDLSQMQIRVHHFLILKLSTGLLGFPDSLAGKAACNAGDPGSIPGSGRSPGEGVGYPLQCSWASLVAQLVKNLPAMQETWVRSLRRGDPLEEGKATRSSILAWRIPWAV